VKEVSEIKYVQLNNEELAKKYLQFYIYRKSPRYNQKINENEEIKLLDLPELELIKVTKEIFNGVDWNSAITSMVGGAAIGSVLLPGIGTLLGFGIGAIIGGSLGFTIGFLPLTQIIQHIVEVIKKDEALQK
jgi:hypothetical protein